MAPGHRQEHVLGQGSWRLSRAPGPNVPRETGLSVVVKAEGQSQGGEKSEEKKGEGQGPKFLGRFRITERETNLQLTEAFLKVGEPSLLMGWVKKEAKTRKCQQCHQDNDA